MNIKRFAGIILSVIIILTGIVPTFAVDKSTTTQSTVINSTQVIILIKACTDRLVKAGTMTKTQAAAIQTALKSTSNSKKTVKVILDSLVKASKTTNTQEENILKYIQPKNVVKNFEFKRTNPMDSLVKAKTITQAQANAIQKVIDSSKNSKKNMKEILDTLVKAKTITMAQENAILKIFSVQGEKSNFNSYPTNSINNLVKSGTITQAQADVIQKAIKASMDSGKTIKDALDALVNAGKITEAQETAVLKVSPIQGGRRQYKR